MPRGGYVWVERDGLFAQKKRKFYICKVSEETEAYLSSMSLHLQKLQAEARYRVRTPGDARFAVKACKKIATESRTAIEPQ